MDTQGELLALRLNRLSPGLAAATSTRQASPSAGKRRLCCGGRAIENRDPGRQRKNSKRTDKSFKAEFSF
jgi:hypothetical protein